MPKPDLRDVALVAVDTANADLTVRALRHCMDQCDFGDAVFITSADIDSSCRVEKISPFKDRRGYAGFVCQQLARHVATKFALIVQWDGYVIDPGCWRPEFLDYDYIGAKWPWHKDGRTVGNGGFSLRSKKLLDILAAEAPPPSNAGEDEYICRILGPKLEGEHGIRFAPENIADLFSYERSLPQNPTFGFHGLFNMWRHAEDSEMESVAAGMADYLLLSREYAEITAQYFALRKFGPMKIFYARLRKAHAAEAVRAHFTALFGNEAFAAQCIAAGEALIAA